jgi:hypothetical protein
MSTSFKRQLPQTQKNTMIRSLHSPDLPIIELCKSGSWDEVSARALTHPLEVAARKRGGQTTALSLAVRAKAPLQTIQDIVAADESQIAVLHQVRGSILHEALKHRVTDDLLEFLVETVARYTKRANVASAMLGRKDELGRVPLHHMVDRIIRGFDHGQTTSDANKRIFECMVTQHPGSIAEIDGDGYTPLVLFLLIPRLGDDPIARKCEQDISHLVHLLLKYNRRVVTVPRRLPRPWHFHSRNITSPQQGFLHGQGVPSPLTCAILHGRHLETVQLIIAASRAEGVNSCSEVVTHHRETPLHVAATVKAPIDILTKLLQGERRAVNVPDARGLLPLDLIWIRHVVDHSCAPSGLPVKASRRRFITATFVEQYHKVTQRYLDGSKAHKRCVSEETHDMSGDLLDRMSTILPVMADLRLTNVQRHEKKEDDSMEVNTCSSNFSLIHAACAVNCPLAVIGLVVETCPESLKIRDPIMGRLPLHFAAGRSEYHQRFPTGVTGNPINVTENSPVPFILSKFPEACRVTDSSRQLPLHVAIDYTKKRGYRDKSTQEITLKTDPFKEVVFLLDEYPDALHQRDGMTKLYPFQQAAEGEYGNVDLTFMLLRRDPVLIYLGGKITQS